MYEIKFSVRLKKADGSTIELFVIERWLAKKLLNNLALYFYLAMCLF